VPVGQGDRLVDHPARQLISLDAVRGYACEVVGDGPDAAAASVTRFDAGNRHAVYRVADVVVRVSLSDDPGERAQVEREAAVLAQLQGVAAPRLLDVRLESEWFDAPVMCIDHVPGEHRDLAALDAPQLEQLGAALARVHALPLDEVPETSESYRSECLQRVVDGMSAVRDPLPVELQARLRHALALVTGSPPPGDDEMVRLHGDPSTGNILWSPDPVLIDWEYTRVGAPADEIAYLFSQNGLTAEQRDAFWRGYGERSDHIAWWEPLSLLGSTLWWIERWQRRNASDADPSVPRDAAYYLDEALRRLDRFEELPGADH
jgi:aminoglycoside phosphotransferase (APT) family kinase protein